MYHYVKEFGEGIDRVCREQEANGARIPSFHTDEFILKITVPKVMANVSGTRIETEQKPNRNQAETEQKQDGNRTETGVKLTEIRVSILQLMKDNPYITKADLASILNVHPSAISRNIEAMRGKYLRRVGPDKGGFWEIIE